MHFKPTSIYHVYNRGNDKQKLFFNRANYLYFLQKVRTEWLSLTEILGYCLMPNHFHFVLAPNENACAGIFLSGRETAIQALSKTIGKTLSSYTTAVNKQEKRTGNLFQHKTKAKFICANHPVSVHDPYLLACVQYVHANPRVAGLVAGDTDWEFSSARDYAGLRNGTLCNQALLFAVSGMSFDNFIPERMDEDELMKRLY